MMVSDLQFWVAGGGGNKGEKGGGNWKTWRDEGMEGESVGILVTKWDSCDHASGILAPVC